MTAYIANALVTATPEISGLPTVSGYTDSRGQIALPLYVTAAYTLTFSGVAIGNVAHFIPTNKSFTLYTIKNKGTKGLIINGQSLAPGNTVYGNAQSLDVKPSATPFKSWAPGSLFKSKSKSQTQLIMPSRDVSISFTGNVAKLLYAVDGSHSGVIANNNAYDPSTNTWTAKANDLTARADLAAGVIGSLLYVVDGDSSASTINHAYDPSTNTWTAKANDLTARSFLAAGVA